MRILLGHNFYRSAAPSGEDAVFRSELALLQSSGVQVDTITRSNDSLDDASLLRTAQVAHSVAWSRAGYKSVVDAIADSNPDVVHFHNTFPLFSPSVYKACSDRGVPVVQTVHNFRHICPAGLLYRDRRVCEKCVGKLPFPSLRYRCYRNSLAATLPVAWMVARNRVFGSHSKYVAQFLAPTMFVKKKLVEGGYPEERISVKPHFLTETPDPGDGREGYAIFVGRLTSEKGLETLLSAWSRVRREIELLIVGDGALRGALEARVKDERLNVRFIGLQSRPEVVRMIRSARVLVAPSECYETFGMTVIEANACGTPAIVSSIGGLAENVVNGETGWHSRPGDATQLAKIVDQVGNDPADYLRVRANARRHYEQHFTAEISLQALLAVYNRVIKSNVPDAT